MNKYIDSIELRQVAEFEPAKLQKAMAEGRLYIQDVKAGNDDVRRVIFETMSRIEDSSTDLSGLAIWHKLLEDERKVDWFRHQRKGQPAIVSNYRLIGAVRVMWEYGIYDTTKPFSAYCTALYGADGDAYRRNSTRFASHEMEVAIRTIIEEVQR